MRLTPAAVIFDSDGVLVDSHPQVVAAWRQLAVEFDLDIDTLLVELVGARAVDTLGRHVPPSQLHRVTARLEDLEVETADEAEPVPGAPELVAALPRDSWAIVTSATRRLAEARWRGAGIPVPDTVVTAEQVSAGKPDPEPFLTGAALLGRAPARCLVFEDSRPGGQAATAAGASVVAVGRQLWDLDPTARVDDLRAVTVDRPNGGGDLVLRVDPARSDLERSAP